MSFEAKLNGLIIELHSINALKFGDFKMKVGINSPVYFDLRVIVSYPKLLDLLADLILEFTKTKNVKYDKICGVPYTALPIATLVSVKSNKSMLMRRKEAKSYGTKKMVEGVFNVGEKILIVEDVVTSGSSILETYSDLVETGLNVTDAIVVVDREQGGAKNLLNNGVQIHSLTTLSKIMEILKAEGRISDDTVKSVKNYITNTQIPVNRNGQSLCDSRLSKTYRARSQLVKCQVSKVLFDLMEKKSSNLCLAADVDTADELLELAKAVGPYIVLFKIHIDVVKDFSLNTAEELKTIAQDMDFLIMEDRKFADIGNTVRAQFINHAMWADLVTVHGLPGHGILDAIKEVYLENKLTCKGVFLIAELSSKDNLIKPSYTKDVVSLVESYSDLVAGLVCQSPGIVTSPGLLQLTPGVKLTPGKDGLGQQYVTPDDAILQKGADIVVVGRGITQAESPKFEAIKIKETLWKAYEKRISIQ